MNNLPSAAEPFSASSNGIVRDVPVSHREAIGQLQKILAHPLFENSGRLSHLLAYLVEQSFVAPAGEMKEYAIGLDVFGRDPSFDPRQDSVVRANATRLRAKLTRYYENDGRNDALVVELRRGAYCPVITRRSPAAQPETFIATEPFTPAPARPRAKTPVWIAVAAAAILALLLAARAAAPTRKPSAAGLAPRPFFVRRGSKRTRPRPYKPGTAEVSPLSGNAGARLRPEAAGAACVMRTF